MMKTDKVKVIGWTRYSDTYREWWDFHKPDNSAELAVLNEIKRRGFKFGGTYHQYGEFGCPVLSDGCVFLASMRHWGGMMATVWGGDYVDYAWENEIDGGKVPTPRDYAKAECLTQEDIKRLEDEREKAKKEYDKLMKENGVDVKSDEEESAEENPIEPTEEQKEAEKKEEERVKRYNALMEKYPLLYARRHLSMRKTCMCWGIECGMGWYNPIDELSCRLEALNLAIGKKYGFLIRAEQVKEKYGTLRFYHSIEHVIPKWKVWLSAPFDKVADAIYNLAKSVESKNEKWFKIYSRISDIFTNVASWITSPSCGADAQSIIIEAVTDMVEKAVDEAEKECYRYCEDCGMQIGYSWSKRFRTDGWISYLCEKCAKKTGRSYSVMFSDAEVIEKMRGFLSSVNFENNDVLFGEDVHSPLKTAASRASEAKPKKTSKPKRSSSKKTTKK